MFWGIGRVSYVDLMMKRSLAYGIFHMSDHDVALLVTASTVVHLLCCLWPTLFTWSDSCSILMTSETNISLNHLSCTNEDSFNTAIHKMAEIGKKIHRYAFLKLLPISSDFLGSVGGIKVVKVDRDMFFLCR